MQKLISKYGLAAHLALLAVAPLFLFPFFEPSTAATVELWLVGFALVWVLMEPSRRSNEMLHDARTRVTGAMIRDPLLWALLVVAAFTALRWANGGVAMKCDFNNGSPLWYLKAPSCPFLPGGVSGTGYPVFVTAVGAAVLMLGCGHALGKTARLSFLFAVSTLSGVAALVDVALCEFGCTGALAQAWCGDMSRASFVGAAFGLNLLSGVAALVGVIETGWMRTVLLLLFSVGGNLVGLFFFAPAPVQLAYLAVAVVALLIALAYAFLSHGLTAAARCLMIFLVTLALPVLVILGVMISGERSETQIAASVRLMRTSPTVGTANASRSEIAQAAMYQVCRNRLAAYSDGTWFPEKYAAHRAVLSQIALRTWKDHPWIGTGVGSYGLALRFAARPEDWAALSSGSLGEPLVGALRSGFGEAATRGRSQDIVAVPAEWAAIGIGQVESPFNGWWKILSERGIVGTLVMAAVLGLLLFHLVRRALVGWRRSVFWPGCAVGLLALMALVAETFVDASLLRSEVLMPAAAFLALSANSFPPAKQKTEKS